MKRLLILTVFAFSLICFSYSQSNNSIEILPERNLPLEEMTNFDNYKQGKELTKSEVIEMGLIDIVKKSEGKVYANYRLHISEEFYTIVISYYPSDNELNTVLVNLTKGNKKIDHCIVAYDEIAESIYKVYSKIEIDKIEVTSRNTFSESPVIKTKIFKILNNGNIEASH